MKQIGYWLLICCLFIALMVLIGGLTRLTESGLSITNWQPFSGVIPPLSDNTWQQEFSKYQTSPEYLKKNFGMSIDEFKGIFWLEYIHRLIARLVGVVFFIPLMYFFIKKELTLKESSKLFGIFALGGMQGFIGWFMVQSGLKDAPHVNHLWLAFHLITAFFIYALIFWQSLKYLGVENSHNYTIPSPKPLLLLVLLQIIFGAFVAGTHAGLMYNTFPDMDGALVPSGLFVMSPWYLNFIQNATMIQFTHRILAYAVVIYIFIFWSIARKNTLTTHIKYAINSLPIIAIIQLLLGILTIIHAVPIPLASLHQVFALVLFTNVILIEYRFASC